MRLLFQRNATTIIFREVQTHLLLRIPKPGPDIAMFKILILLLIQLIVLHTDSSIKLLRQCSLFTQCFDLVWDTGVRIMQLARHIVL